MRTLAPGHRALGASHFTNGHSWCDQWQTLTTPATVSHIRVEQTNTRTLPGGTEYYTGIRFGQ